MTTELSTIATEARSKPTPVAKRLAHAAAALSDRGFNVSVARSRTEATRLAVDLVPDGSRVHTGASVTIAELGITDELERSGRYLPVRPAVMAMDRASQADEIRRLVGTPDVFLASAAAVTDDGRILIASGSGSQVGPIASGAARVILVIGAQKLVADLGQAYRRLEEHVLPLESARSMAAYGRTASLNQTLVLHGGGRGRISVVLVPDAIGF
jgi:acyl-CoA hydrolase